MAACPVCVASVLAPVQLNAGMPALGCGKCRGILVNLITYRDWRDRGGASETSLTDMLKVEEAPRDSSAMLRCPKCTGFMTKYRVSANSKNRLDFCSNCDEVWLDSGEWKLLEALALNGKLTHIFSAPWQKQVLNIEMNQRFEETQKTLFGSDYAKLCDIREWVATHPKKNEMLAYLYRMLSSR
jgi:Zn-finger nucleic acid-binding protein